MKYLKGLTSGAEGGDIVVIFPQHRHLEGGSFVAFSGRGPYHGLVLKGLHKYAKGKAADSRKDKQKVYLGHGDRLGLIFAACEFFDGYVCDNAHIYKCKAKEHQHFFELTLTFRGRFTALFFDLTHRCCSPVFFVLCK